MRIPFRRRPAPPLTQPTPPGAPPPPTATQPTVVTPQAGPAVTQPPAAPPPPGAAVPPVAAPLAGAPRPAPTPAAMATEIENLRAWIAQLDRKIGIRTYIAAATTVLAVAAAAIALVIAVDARDNSASDDDLNEIEGQIVALSEQAVAAAGAQSAVESLATRVAALESAAADDALAPSDPADLLPESEGEVPEPAAPGAPEEPGAKSGGKAAGDTKKRPGA